MSWKAAQTAKSAPLQRGLTQARAGNERLRRSTKRVVPGHHPLCHVSAATPQLRKTKTRIGNGFCFRHICCRLPSPSHLQSEYKIGMRHPLHPTGRPVAEFFGLRYLRSKDLIAMGLIPNRVTLNRMIRDGEFPRPLRLTSRVLLWDSTEIAALLERLGAERNGGGNGGEGSRGAWS
jgi:predicted DNA-binding transcriptional regulator AlpA